MQIFNASKEITQRLDKEIDTYVARYAPQHELAIILVGNNPSSIRFTQLKKDYCGAHGIKSTIYTIEATLEDTVIFSYIREIVSKNEVGGVVLQLPFPRESLNDCLSLIPLEKDVDILSPEAAKKFYSGNYEKLPPVVRAFNLFLETITNTHRGIRRVKVIGNGFLVGRPVSHFLETSGFKVSVEENYETGQKIVSDVLVLSAGIPGLVKGPDICAGCHVVDFGSTIVNGKTYGELDYATSLEHLGIISVSPGGMGPLVIRFLIKNFLGI